MDEFQEWFTDRSTSYNIKYDRQEFENKFNVFCQSINTKGVEVALEKRHFILTESDQNPMRGLELLYQAKEQQLLL